MTLWVVLVVIAILVFCLPCVFSRRNTRNQAKGEAYRVCQDEDGNFYHRPANDQPDQREPVEAN